jgi:acetylornithine aminotransferase
VGHVKEISAYLDSRLEYLAQWFPDLIQHKIRGRGLLRGLGFKNEAHPGQVVQLARERGVLVLTAGKDVVRLVPSLNVGKDEVDVAIDVLEGCLTVLRG